MPGGVTVTGDPPDHFASGTSYAGQDSPMQPSVLPGVRRTLTPLEYAALADIGWEVSTTPAGAPAAGSAYAPAVSAAQSAPATAAAVVRVVGRVTVGTATGTATVGAGGAVAQTAQPFGPDYAAGVRVVTADVTGDGVPDVIAGTGPGGPAEVRVLDGATGAVVATIHPFEAGFTGGVFVAAGDITRDGRADVVVTPDQGGGPVVAVSTGRTATGRRPADPTGPVFRHQRPGVPRRRPPGTG